MRAGRLDRLVTLQRPVKVETSAHGEKVSTWEDEGVVWAEKKDLRGDERYQAAQLTAKVDTQWRIRHRSDVRPTWRLVIEGEVYDIKEILEIGRREGLQLMTERIWDG